LQVPGSVIKRIKFGFDGSWICFIGATFEPSYNPMPNPQPMGGQTCQKGHNLIFSMNP